MWNSQDICTKKNPLLLRREQYLFFFSNFSFPTKPANGRGEVFYLCLGFILLMNSNFYCLPASISSGCAQELLSKSAVNLSNSCPSVTVSITIIVQHLASTNRAKQNEKYSETKQELSLSHVDSSSQKLFRLLSLLTWLHCGKVISMEKSILQSQSLIPTDFIQFVHRGAASIVVS